MTTITRQSLRALQADIIAALAAVGAKHGVAITEGGASFSPERATMKLNVLVIGGAQAADVGEEAQSAPATTGHEQTWVALAKNYGLKPEWFGRTVKMAGSTFRIIGLSPNRTKNVVRIERVSTGKVFVADAASIIAACA
jgi:hypothetical protein